jgi:hypothetical protein
MIRSFADLQDILIEPEELAAEVADEYEADFENATPNSSHRSTPYPNDTFMSEVDEGLSFRDISSPVELRGSLKGLHTKNSSKPKSPSRSSSPSDNYTEYSSDDNVIVIPQKNTGNEVPTRTISTVAALGTFCTTKVSFSGVRRVKSADIPGLNKSVTKAESGGRDRNNYQAPVDDNQIKSMVRTVLTEENRLRVEENQRWNHSRSESRIYIENVSRRAVHVTLPKYHPTVAIDPSFPKVEDDALLDSVPYETSSGCVDKFARFKKSQYSGLDRERMFTEQLNKDFSIGMTSSGLLARGNNYSVST